MRNILMNQAQAAKKDEFYTQIEDVQQELYHFREHFREKVIYLNCDDPEHSAFWEYFSLNFDFLGIKKLISTHYDKEGNSSYMLVLEEQYNRNEPNIIKKNLKGNGDFRSDECIELLKEADIVATNPPFSLWREYVAQLIEYDKNFIILGSQNAMSYKDIFPLLQEGKMWLGNTTNKTMWFAVPDDYELKEGNYKIEYGRYLVKVPAISWYTNLDYSKRHEDMMLTKFYEGNEDNYPKYDNYDAIEVPTVKEIPLDYPGIMGVPVTFLNNHNPEQFEVLGITKTWFGMADKIYDKQIQVNPDGTEKDGVTKLNDGAVLELDEPLKKKVYYKYEGKMYRQTFPRILVRNKKPISKKEILGF